MSDQVIYKVNYLPNVGYLTGPIPKQLLNAITEEVDLIKEDFLLAEQMNDKLIGNIATECKLTKCRGDVSDFVMHMVNEYDKQFNYLQNVSLLSKDVPLVLTSLWVNFQKKYEFNPIHDHSGVFSFVFWLKIPFDKYEERKVYKNSKDQHVKKGAFEFIYVDTLGDLRVCAPSDCAEGNFCLFPAGMNHSVYPFYTSDDYRISVAGNVSFEC